MKELATGRTIQIVINKQTWIDRKKFEIPSTYIDFFPEDSLGARGQADQAKFPSKGTPVEFNYGLLKSTCDIATRKSGTMRPRDNSAMRKFLEANRFGLGDVICITQTAERSYYVSLIKHEDGSTIY